MRELRGFMRLTLAPGATGVARFNLTSEDLRYDRGASLEAMMRGWEAGEFIVMVGPNARDTQALTVTWHA